jgi:predicted metal-dependent HD superfamily phosphohydrolase
MDLEIMKIQQELKVRFLRMVHSGTSELHIDMVWGELVSQYSDPNRHYHNLNHLYYMFKFLEAHVLEEVDAAMTFAVLYHDYYLTSEFGVSAEERSALKCVEIMEGFGYPTSDCLVAYHYIIHTAYHTSRLENMNDLTKAFMDADIYILGADAKRYNRYSENIYKEYRDIHKVPHADFLAGRISFLKEMGLRDQTSYMGDRDFEISVFNNIHREMVQLKNELADIMGS